jgi:hypothetical protein
VNKTYSSQVVTKGNIAVGCNTPFEVLQKKDYLSIPFSTALGQTIDYKIGMCCFTAKHVALRRKSKDMLARDQNNMSEWCDMSTRGLLFQ